MLAPFKAGRRLGGASWGPLGLQPGVLGGSGDVSSADCSSSSSQVDASAGASYDSIGSPCMQDPGTLSRVMQGLGD